MYLVYPPFQVGSRDGSVVAPRSKYVNIYYYKICLMWMNTSVYN